MLDKILTVGAFIVLGAVLLVALAFIVYGFYQAPYSGLRWSLFIVGIFIFIASCMKVDNYYIKKGPR